MESYLSRAIARIANPLESVMAWGSGPHLSAKQEVVDSIVCVSYNRRIKGV
jgi:hypothetical protein